MRVFGLVLAAGCACGAASLVEAGAPSVESVASGVGQRGTEFRLRLVGAGLADTIELIPYLPGTTCLGVDAASDNEVTICLRSSAECALGSHPFRLRTRQGLSELRTFDVTPFPVVAEAEPNGTIAAAQTVPRNVTITGIIEAGDVDSFGITLRKGECLSAEVQGVRLGGAMLDTVLTVLGPDGKKVVSVDDTSLFRQDPFVTLIAPADGLYVVQVRETNFDGDENSRYALHLGTFPRPAFVYPLGGQAGQPMTVRFGGDARGTFEQEIRLPQSTDGIYGLFAERTGLLSPTPHPVRVSTFANILESEPNDDPPSAGSAAVDLPIAFNGILERPGDKDGFRFRTAKGVVWQFEAFASRLGSPLDSVISISEGTGRILVSNDDDGTHDSRLIFTAPHEGEYLLTVADKRGQGGENFVYRVEAAERRPRVSAFLPRPNRLSQERQAIVVPRGNRVAALIGVQRTGFDGEVHLAARGLPPGVSFSETNISAEFFRVPVVIEAYAEASLGAALVEVQATAEAGSGTVTGSFVQVIDLVAGSADALFTSVAVDRLAVAVVEECPFTISLDEPKTSLAQDGTIAFQIHVERQAGFDAAVDVTFPFLPPWVDGPDKITIAADQSTAIYTARAFPQAEPRTWRLCAEAKAGGSSARQTGMSAAGGARSGRRRGSSRGSTGPATPVSSQLVTLHIAESPVTGTIGTVAAEQGQELRLVCKIAALGGLPDQMTGTLEGLPNRVSADPVTVSRDDRSVSFAVRLEPTAPVGSFSSLVCRLTGMIDGQEVSYCVGRSGVLRIEPRGGLVTDDAGRPLSRLESLRKSQKPTANEDRPAR